MKRFNIHFVPLEGAYKISKYSVQISVSIGICTLCSKDKER